MSTRSVGSFLPRIGLFLFILSGCGHDGATVVAGPDDAGATLGSPEAAAVDTSGAAEAALAWHRARFAATPGAGSGLRLLEDGAARLETDGQWLRPVFADGAAPDGATVALPLDARSTFTLRARATGMSADVALVGAHGALGEIARGLVIYRGAAPDGGDLLHRPTAAGTEDFVVLEREPPRPEVAYRVIPGDGVAGLRLVGNTLELLAADGDPQLRMAPPYLIDARGARHEARVAVDGCAVDESPAAPWRRPVTAPGAAACTVRVSWDGARVAYPALLDPSWTGTGSLGIGREYHTLTNVTVGGAPMVLVAGGYSNLASPAVLVDAELFDPTGNGGIGSWTPTGTMKAGRYDHTASTVNITVNTGGLKPTGTMVLVAGGYGTAGALNSSELYNPATGLWDWTWNALGSQTSMVAARYWHTATSLTAGGKVLAAGGVGLRTAEIFDPATGNWVATGSMVYQRDGHAANLLASGKVLATGGSSSTTTAELYDPGAGTWAYTQNSFGVQTMMSCGHLYHTATVLPSGKVLVAAGQWASACAELYDPTSQGFTLTASLNVGRHGHAAQLVAFPPAGAAKAVVMGGYGNNVNTSTTSVEVFEPTLNGGSGGWVVLPNMSQPRLYMPAALLASGKVLVAGGYQYQSGSPIAFAELFDPSGTLPNRLPCSVNADCQGGQCVDGWCCNAACGGACDRCNVVGSEGTCTAAPTGDIGQPQCAGNLVCHGAATCPATCLDDSYCLPTAYCSSGSCVLRQVLGSPCTANDQCLSGMCVDSVCCDAACSGACDVCNAAAGASPNGHCTNVTGPGVPACGGGAYVCTGSSPSCPSSCSDDSVCGATYYCNTSTHQCVAKLAKGAGCTAGNQCQSGLYCVDGYCCDSPCSQQCGACNVGGHQGTCYPVTGAPVGGRALCAGSGTCGGTCNGSTIDACTFPGASTVCRAASCSAGTATLEGDCDGAGACPSATTVGCGAYVCGATACLTSCANDTQCASGYWCHTATSSCVAKGVAGSDCTATNQCQSALQCVDGKCCTGSCTGQCEACNVAGHAGTCWPQTGAPVGARTPCLTDGTACGGSCDGSTRTACTYPGAGTVCRAGSCAAGVATNQATCVGTGSCPSVSTTACTPYVCGPNACKTTCTADGDCVAGYFCDATQQCVPRYAAGHACAGTTQCASGLTCVDGVCCTSACTEQCKSCNLPGSVGTCAFVTGAPVGGRSACASDGTVCAGTCDGSHPSCGYPDAATTCRNASCSGGVATTAAGCNGAGACPAPSTTACGQYACGPTACYSSCSSDGQCAAGAYCSAGTCLAKHASGVCVVDGECTSGHCVDGVCCDRACGGQCEACNLGGSVGTCTAVTGAPKGTRPQCAGSGTCAGACNGTNTATCTYPPTTTACRAASCAAGTATLAASCDGVGGCPAPSLVPCTPYVCGATACKASCAVDADCVSGDFCDAQGHCAPKLALGATCGAATQCLSANCVDGVCCDDACLGNCQACNAAGHCAAVTGAPRNGRPACASDGSACGGACDGSAPGCVYPISPCRAASCAAGVATAAAACDGAGACPPPVTLACSPFVCGPTACLTGCTGDGDCQVGHYCSGGQCLAKHAAGSCTSDVECTTGHCADGVCCDTACTGQCEACDLAGSVSVCTAVTGAPAAPRPACGGSGVCAGACNGANRDACVMPGAATTCRAASCTAGVATSSATCDGAGACPAPATRACAPYVCGATACLAACAADADCVPGDYCTPAGHCAGRLGQGAACGADSWCSSGHCVDGVCCDTACEGQCQACNVDGFEGTCTVVAGEPLGTRPPCASDGSACGGACDGVDGLACTYPSSASVCRAASCASGVETLEATCDGAGACPPAETFPCAPFACGATACRGSCAGAADCAPGDYCASGACRRQRAPGAACVSAAECQSGFCADGVCCDRACGGQCEACNVAGSAGTCAPVTGAPAGSRPACVDGGSGCGGSCDGVHPGSCAYPDATTSCTAGACADGIATLPATCDGAGSCPAPTTAACAPYACGTDGCLTSCVGPADCVPGGWCDAGACRAQLPDGGLCGGDAACASGHCVDGVCCDTACEGQCEACNVTGSVGTCSIVTGPPAGGRPACAGSGVCGGTCDGTSRTDCVFPDETTACAAAACADGVAAAAAFCNGLGDCAPPLTTACALGCDGDVCATPASADAGPRADAGGTGDGGAAGDGGAPPAGDGGVPPPEKSAGCGCRTGGDAADGAAALLGVSLLGLALGRRPRRRGRPGSSR